MKFFFYNHDLGPIQTQNGQNLDLFTCEWHELWKKVHRFGSFFEKGPNFFSFHETKRSKIITSMIILESFYWKMAKMWTFLLANDMDCDKKVHSFRSFSALKKVQISYHFTKQKGPNYHCFNDNFGIFLSKDGKNVDLFTWEWHGLW